MVRSGRPVCSPGRPEAYTPIFMRFLRSNVGSKSRGRSRSGAIFVRKRNQTTVNQEPSSPKVTCIGQVRIGRSKKPCSRRVGGWSWFRRALLCHSVRNIKPKSFRKVVRKWVTCSCSNFWRKSEIKEESRKKEVKLRGSVLQGQKTSRDEEEEEEENEGSVKITNFSASSSSSPPRNALLLMRSRSAPYRSSSLAIRFWGSPVAEQESEAAETRREENQEWELQKESISGESDHETQESEKRNSHSEGSDCGSKENVAQSANTGVKTEGLMSDMPTKLTRCKSEPARTGEKLVPDLGVPARRRFGFT